MSQIILDDDLRTKLNGLNQTVEVRDPTGKTVGQFVPQDEYLKLLYALANPPLTDAELEQVKRSGTWHKLADVLDRRGRQ